MNDLYNKNSLEMILTIKYIKKRCVPQKCIAKDFYYKIYVYKKSCSIKMHRK